MQPIIECGLCRVDLQKHQSSAARRAGHPATMFSHPIDQFPRAYGRNVDNGNDIRLDNCGIYGINTGTKLQENGLPWGWIDGETGIRLCGSEELESHFSCGRERFHEGDHQDSVGHEWHQRKHFLLTRAPYGGSAAKHLDLYDTQAKAEVAASYDLGGKPLTWVLNENRAGQYFGVLPDSLAYMITFIDVSNVQSWLDSAMSAVVPSPA
jgi:hypothetical protein